MCKTTVVNCREETFDVYIGRPGERRPLNEGWGNPIRIRYEKDRERVLEEYLRWIITQPELLERLHELKGKRLGCWCKPKKCHGDTLALLADADITTREEAAQVLGITTN